MLRPINSQIFTKKNYVLNTLPLLQRTHSVEIIGTSSGNTYVGSKPLNIQRWTFELASLIKEIGLQIANALGSISLPKQMKYNWITLQLIHSTLSRINRSKQNNHNSIIRRRGNESSQRKWKMKTNWRLSTNEETIRTQTTTAGRCSRLYASLLPNRAYT